MDFSFSDEQSLLKDSVERFIQNDYAFDARQKLVKNDPGFSTKNWKTFADLGGSACRSPKQTADSAAGRSKRC